YDSYDDNCSDESTYYPSVTTCTDTSEAKVEIDLTCVYKYKPSFSGRVYPRIFTTNANSSKKLHSGSSVSMGSDPP
ncbi:hypothetical protein AVEN_201285-1, partial [Araneus ventricosus]